MSDGFESYKIGEKSRDTLPSMREPQWTPSSKVRPSEEQTKKSSEAVRRRKPNITKQDSGIGNRKTFWRNMPSNVVEPPFLAGAVKKRSRSSYDLMFKEIESKILTIM